MPEMKRTAIVLFFFMTSIRVHAQADSAKPFKNHIWLSFGSVYCSASPNVCFSNSRTLQGGQIALTCESSKQVLSLKVYSVHDFYGSDFWGYYNATANKLSQLGDISLSYGHRFQYKWGSVIPAAGLSFGALEYRGRHTDTTYLTGMVIFGSSTIYHFEGKHFYYLGVPMSCRVLTSIHHVGIELEAYCNLHPYADMGLATSVSIGTITNYRKEKKRKLN